MLSHTAETIIYEMESVCVLERESVASETETRSRDVTIERQDRCMWKCIEDTTTEGRMYVINSLRE